MPWWPFGRRLPDDAAAAGGGPCLLVATFGRLLWYFPETDTHRMVQEGRGKYYGMAPAGPAWAQDGRVLVVSRPDQARDDRLLLIDHRTGRTLSRTQLVSRDTHHAVRAGARLFVTDTFRGRIVVHRLPDLSVERTYDAFTHENHVNTLLVESDALLCLCHNKGRSSLAVLDRRSGEVVDAFDDVGEHSHDLAEWRGRIVLCDSRGGGLRLLDRETRRSEVLFAEAGTFTKGLAVAGDVAWFGISQAATRSERIAVSCDLVAYDLAAGRVLWRRAIPSGGLVNSIVTAAGLDDQLRATPGA